MSYKLNQNALNFSVNLTPQELMKLKSIKTKYKHPVNGYIRFAIINLLKQIGQNLENIDKFFPDKSKRKPVHFGESFIAPKYIDLINRISKERGISRKELLRKALELTLNSSDNNPEAVAKRSMS